MVEQRLSSPDESAASAVADDVELIEPDRTSEVEQDIPAISEPAKVMRIGSMIRTLLDEVREAELDEASRDRMREIYEQSVSELSEALAPELREELARLALPFSSDSPSEAELRVAQAQLVGWLEGLFHGIQAAVAAQQMMAQRQLMEMRQGALPPGLASGDSPNAGAPDSRPGGVYL
ncbi:MAG: proteasome activator [Actinomycetota bacterium]|nr:proteasome activator [Actinomycetota bacterium]